MQQQQGTRSNSAIEGGNNVETVNREIGQLEEELLGKTCGKCKPRREVWWWNDEIQQCLMRKKHNTEENKEAYRIAKEEAKRKIASAKARACKVL